jgi:galactose-6-phosphate isomerase
MSRPFLDVSGILLDPDFCDTTLCVMRNQQTVSDGGIADDTSTRTPISGVVTTPDSDLVRLPEGGRAPQTIAVHTKFELTAMGGTTNADIVVWNGRQYTVVAVEDYSTYGAGFVTATCELISVSNTPSQ